MLSGDPPIRVRMDDICKSFGAIKSLDRVNLVLRAGEVLGLVGAISAVASQKHTDSVKVFGWDLTAQAIKGIDEGWIVAVVQQDPFQEGVAGVETILKLKKGEQVNPSIDIPVTIVTKENVDKFRSLFK